jgi:hypothetical protein
MDQKKQLFDETFLKRNIITEIASNGLEIILHDGTI